jgi:hypothetical protein
LFLLFFFFLFIPDYLHVICIFVLCLFQFIVVWILSSLIWGFLDRVERKPWNTDEDNTKR